MIEVNVIQINVGIMINVNLSVKNVKKIMLPMLENGKQLTRIMGDSVFICDEVIFICESYEETKTSFNQKQGNCKTKNFYILLAFSLITTALLIAVSIYSYL